MISKYDVIKSFDRAGERGERFALYLSEDKKNVLDSETNRVMCTIDEFVQYVRETEHCDFEHIFYEHASLTNIYRCRQCGTVIFGGDDEYHYNPNEKCPTCCNDPSVCHNEYWTKEQIDSDPEKQKTIEDLISAQKEMDEAEKRRQARGGLYDWQRWKRKFYTKHRGYEFTLINSNWDKQLPHSDRYLEIHTWKRSDSIVDHHWQIPLSWYHFYILHIFPYSKKCIPEFRKYYFWQKKLSN